MVDDSAFRTLDNVDVKGKRVLLRVDLNVPMRQNKVQDKTRLIRVLPTINEIAGKGGRVILASHFDRPNGRYDPSMSLAPLVDELSSLLGKAVAFAPDCVGSAALEAASRLKNGEILLLENLRFHAEEENNAPTFAQGLASLADIYVNDAFSCSHRAHASIVGVADILPSCAGRLMQAELEALEAALSRPEKPVMAIVGGSKISTKLKLLSNLVAKVDVLVIGGGMANTFLHAMGVNVGKSLHEPGMSATAIAIMGDAKQKGCEIILPLDAVCAAELEAGQECRITDINNIPPDAMILDVGPRTVSALGEKLASMKTILWNGPLGAFETTPFDASTIMLGRMISYLTADNKIKSIAGGGDTVSALARSGVLSGLTYVSTAGGAFLEWLEGKTLPGVAVLYSVA